MFYIILYHINRSYVLMNTTISQSFVKIGSKTKIFLLPNSIFFVNKQLALFFNFFKILLKISENACLTQTIEICLRNPNDLNFFIISVSCLFTKHVYGPSFVPVQDTEMLGPSTRLS